MVEQAVITPGDDWPHRCVLSEHEVYHAAPGAVTGNRGRQCPSCMTLLWDARNEARGPHTVERCASNQAWLERQEQDGGRPQPQLGPGAPKLEW